MYLAVLHSTVSVNAATIIHRTHNILYVIIRYAIIPSVIIPCTAPAPSYTYTAIWQICYCIMRNIAICNIISHNAYSTSVFSCNSGYHIITDCQFGTWHFTAHYTAQGYSAAGTVSYNTAAYFGIMNVAFHSNSYRIHTGNFTIFDLNVFCIIYFNLSRYTLSFSCCHFIIYIRLHIEALLLICRVPRTITKFNSVKHNIFNGFIVCAAYYYRILSYRSKYFCR